MDEHAQGIFTKIITKLLIMADIVYEGMTKDQLLPAISIAGTVIFIIAAGYFMAYLVLVLNNKNPSDNLQQRSKNHLSILHLHFIMIIFIVYVYELCFLDSLFGFNPIFDIFF